MRFKQYFALCLSLCAAPLCPSAPVVPFVTISRTRCLLPWLMKHPQHRPHSPRGISIKSQFFLQAFLSPLFCSAEGMYIRVLHLLLLLLLLLLPLLLVFTPSHPPRGE